MINYAPVFNPILEGINDCIVNKRPYCVIRIARGEGKTYGIMFAIIELLKGNPGWNAFIVTNTQKQIKENVQDSGYLKKFGVVDPDWRKTSAGNYTYKNGSVLMFGGMNDVRAVERNRGKHPNIIYHDEAQNWTQPHKWLSIFGEMGKDKNCLKIVSGTGWKDQNNLLTFIENQIKAGASDGIVIRKTAEDIINDDTDLESKEIRRKNLDDAINLATVYYENPDGEMIEAKNGRHVPEIRRELFVEDIGGETKGGIVFTQFDEDNVVSTDYVIDFKKPVYVVCDYGTRDPSGVILAQTDGDIIHIFAELYKTRTKNWMAFARDLMVLLSDLGLLKASEAHVIALTGEEIEIEKYDIEFLHKDIRFYGDHHGFTNWNPQLSQFFLTQFGEVGEAQEGIEYLKKYIASKQLKINYNCPVLISKVQSIAYETDHKKIAKYHMELDHDESHLITPVAYLLLLLIYGEEIDIVRRPTKEVPKIEVRSTRPTPVILKSQDYNNFL